MDAEPGDFAQSITTLETELFTLPFSTLPKVGDTVLNEIRLIGKECRSACSVLKQTGKSNVHQERVFARVVRKERQVRESG